MHLKFTPLHTTSPRGLSLIAAASLIVAGCLGTTTTSGSDSDSDSGTETETESTGGDTSETSVGPSTSVQPTSTTIDPTTSSTNPTTDGTDPSTTSDPGTGSETTSETETGTDTGVLDDTIYEIQDGTIAPGSEVDVQGVVVSGVAPAGFYVQEPPGQQYSGVWVYTGPDAEILMTLSVGDEVDLLGLTAEFDDQLTEIDVTAGSVTPTGNQGLVVDPELLPVSELENPNTAEPWEGVLVRVQGMNLEVVNEPGYDEFDVSDGEATIRVDEQMFNLYAPDQVDEFPNFGSGAAFTAIQGPLNWSFEYFKIAPRDYEDVEGYIEGPPAEASVEELAEGDLVITEVMYDAGGCGDDVCEWIEVYNAFGQDVNIKGLIIQDIDEAPNKQGVINLKTVITAGNYVWLGRGAADTWEYELPANAYYGDEPGFNNTQAGDKVVIKNSQVTIDSTAVWTGDGVNDDGRSWQLSLGEPDAIANDDPANWCWSDEPFDVNGDMGSPGKLNPKNCP